MRFKYLLLILSCFFLSILWVVNLSVENKNNVTPTQKRLSGPEQFALFHKSIRTAEGAESPDYKPGYRVREFQKANVMAQAVRRSNTRTQSNGVIEWTERGPANVPGRTRGLIVDPDDAAKNTWFAGSVGGGVWKTTNGGANWTLLTPDLPNMATTVLAMAPSNHDVIYLGTGEGFGNLDGISGSGMFRSVDRGQTWTYLPSTSNFNDVNRVIVDPADEDIVVAATNTGIFRTENGGTDWTQTSTLTGIQDLKASPTDFNIQYAARNGVGVLKSTNGGISWSLSNTGMSPNGRVEIAVSPANPNRIFASAEGTLSGSESDLYMSDDSGATWDLVNVSFNEVAIDFLGGQGWYDNTIACDPFDADIVYFGGVNLFKIDLGSGSTAVNNYSIEEDGTSFLTLVNYGAAFAGGRLTVGATANESIEIRFGEGMTQKAHRFQVPTGSTTGVPDENFNYQNYVDVPFEVWDITNNRQLMASFRDQDENGEFNLRLQNTDGTPTEQSREYLYIHDITYQETEAPSIAVNGGIAVERIYFIWPVLAAGNVWPDNIINSELRIIFDSIEKLNSTTTTVSDAYNQFDGKNRFINYGTDIHPDQHNLVMIPVSISTYKILNANDGGIFISNTSATPGTAQGNWTMSGRTYNTSQFYGADKKPGADVYIGGMQDNGTWRSNPNISANNNTSYIFAIGGDGFEVIWHNLDGQKLIGGSQGNNFRRSTDAGSTWSNATSGLSGTHPFVSKLANSRDNPERIYTLSSAGVFYSTNFGASWTLTPITEKWGPSSSLMDVEVSRANANIIWAGSGMVSSGTLRNIHVSLDGGVTFNPTENSPLISGGITKLASHPREENTAYALFSQAGNPKILRTEDLGQTWEDISGFGTGDISTNGFPDVAVYCLYVRPDNPDIIWAGTEIGIVESLDNGQSWRLMTLNDDGFPNVSVWDMKGQDDQVVIATHGRGIWSATIESPQITIAVPEIIAWGTSPKEQLLLKVRSEEDFDKIEFYQNESLLGTVNDIEPSDLIVTIGGLSPGTKSIKMIAYKDTAPIHTKTYSIDHLDILSIEDAYSNYFGSLNALTVKGLTLQNFPGFVTGERRTLQTPHNYANNFEYSAIIRHPVKVNNTLPILQYEDIAIIEPGEEGAEFGDANFKDYVILEASKNGLDWTPLEDGYDARFNSDWLTAFNAASPGSKSMFVNHELSLTDKFAVGDTLLFRFRLFSNASTAGWGWAINYVAIQQAPTNTENPLLSGNQLSLFPNPTTGNFIIEFELSAASEIQAEVIDLLGRPVASKSFGRKEVGTHRETFDLSNQLRGTYLVVLKTNSGNKVGRISVTR